MHSLNKTSHEKTRWVTRTPCTGTYRVFYHGLNAYVYELNEAGWHCYVQKNLFTGRSKLCIRHYENNLIGSGPITPDSTVVRLKYLTEQKHVRAIADSYMEMTMENVPVLLGLIQEVIGAKPKPKPKRDNVVAIQTVLKKVA